MISRIRSPVYVAARSLRSLRSKNRYAMRTCVCYLEIQRSLGKEGNARFANEGHLTFGVHCGRWKARYVSELFHFLKFVMNFLKGVVSICHSF